MENGNINLSDEERLDQEACDWVAKKDRTLELEEQEAFDHWLSLDQRHVERIARHERTWHEIGLLERLNASHSEKTPIDSESDSKIVRFPNRWWKPISVALSIAAAVAFAFVALQPEDLSSAMLSKNQTALEYERHVLEDGSVVELNLGGQVSVAYSKDERRVSLLSGEAHFTVSKNPNRPFIVIAHESAVRAVGTAFTVQLKQESLEVLVTEGRVRMERVIDTGIEQVMASEPLIEEEITIGQRVELSFLEDAVAPVIQEVSERELDDRLAWKHPMLDFVGTPLSEVLEAFNLRNSLQLEVEGNELRELPITATLHSGKPEEFVSILELTEGIQVRRDSSDRIYISKRD